MKTGPAMNARRAFATLLLISAMLGIAFLGLSFEDARQRHDLALWGHHPLFGSGMASLITALLGAAFLISFRNPRGDAE